LFCL
jgi:hypothetical protein